MRGADDNGFISRLAPDGSSELKWIAGGTGGVTLNAPKGMAIADGRLIVADIDHVRTFDAESGAPMQSVGIEGAKFLNDVAIAADGTVYVTGSGTKDVPGAIYELSTDGTVRSIAQGRDLDRPNGLEFDPDGNLVVVTFGSDKVLTMSRDGKLLESRTLPAGQLDGLVVRSDGATQVSSWKGENVVRIGADGAVETPVTGLRTPAAFEVDGEQILVPLVRENRVFAAPLRQAAQG